MKGKKKPHHIKIAYEKTEPVKIPVKVYNLTEDDMRKIEELLRKGE